MQLIKLIKMLGLAAFAAMVAAAFAGATSAMAEPPHPEIVLCEVLELVCNHPYPNPTEIHFETLAGNPPKVLTSIGTIECENSLIIVTLLNKLAKLLEEHLLAYVLTGCKMGGTACTATVNALGGLSLTPSEVKLWANVKPITLEGRTTNVTFKCGSFVNCTFSPSEASELVTKSMSEEEGGHYLFIAENVPLSGKGFLCPSTAKLDAEYHAVNLDKELTLALNLYLEL